MLARQQAESSASTWYAFVGQVTVGFSVYLSRMATEDQLSET
jgi:hypothetical protein